MRKVLFTTLIIFLVLVLGQTLYFNAKDRRNNDFIVGDIYENIKENEISEFIDSSFLLLGAESYYKEPLYKFESSDDIIIEMYLANLDKRKVLMTFYYNVQKDEKIKGLDIKFTTNASNIVIRNEMPLLDLEYEFLNGGFFVPIFINDNSFSYVLNNNEIHFNEIRSIEIRNTYQEDLPKKFKVEITSNKNFNQSNNNVVTLNKDEDKLITNEFNGDVKEYRDLILSESNLVLTNKDKFKPYNKVIVSTLVTYGVAVTLAAVYGIFRKQIHGLFTKNK